MKPNLPAVVALLALYGAAAAHPHRYVDQQAQISVGVNVVDLTIRIVPSSQEGAEIYAHIDRNGNGVVSGEEAAAFAAEVVSKAVLMVNGRNVSFAGAAATVPSAHRVSAGSGVIEVRATASFDLANAEDHRVVFEIAYEDFSHDWFVQPFFYPDLVEATSSQVVERTDRGNRIGISLTFR